MNRMCIDCKCLGVDCKGTDNNVWTGCVYRKCDNGERDLSPYQPIISRATAEERNVCISAAIAECHAQ